MLLLLLLIIELFLPFLIEVAALILFHATQSRVDLVEWPHIQVLHPIFEPLFLVEKVHGDACNGQFQALATFKYEDYIEAEACNYRQLTVAEIAEIHPFVYVYII